MRTLLVALLLSFSLPTLALDPSPRLNPADVVKFQLDSLRQNNAANDDGIASTFKFASPANRSVTGPLSRFSQLFDHPRYAPMINHQRADIELVSDNGRVAVFDVELVDGNGSIHHYRFELSLQQSGACIDCWMTDAVMWAPRPGRSA
ncbi:MAG: DUF4864 domain-containing protein [Pseudomonadota bacterium]